MQLWRLSIQYSRIINESFTLNAIDGWRTGSKSILNVVTSVVSAHLLSVLFLLTVHSMIIKPKYCRPSYWNNEFSDNNARCIRRTLFFQFDRTIKLRPSINYAGTCTHTHALKKKKIPNVANIISYYSISAHDSIPRFQNYLWILFIVVTSMCVCVPPFVHSIEPRICIAIVKSCSFVLRDND